MNNSKLKIVAPDGWFYLMNEVSFLNLDFNWIIYGLFLTNMLPWPSSMIFKS